MSRNKLRGGIENNISGSRSTLLGNQKKCLGSLSTLSSWEGLCPSQADVPLSVFMWLKAGPTCAFVNTLNDTSPGKCIQMWLKASLGSVDRWNSTGMFARVVYQWDTLN